RLDPTELVTRSLRNVYVHGVPISLSLSAFDVPQSMTVQEDVASGGIRITFRYLDDEQATQQRLTPQLTALIGKNSHKLLCFVVAPPPGQHPHDIRIVVA